LDINAASQIILKIQVYFKTMKKFPYSVSNRKAFFQNKTKVVLAVSVMRFSPATPPLSPGDLEDTADGLYIIGGHKIVVQNGELHGPEEPQHQILHDHEVVEGLRIDQLLPQENTLSSHYGEQSKVPDDVPQIAIDGGHHAAGEE